jgi:c-di-GMP-binding flagellar brake protein YcgR
LDKKTGENLSIRRSVRRTIGLSAEISVAPEHESTVRLSGSSDISATAVDMSEGGIGVLSGGYLPRRCLAQVRLISPLDPQKEIFSARVRIARAVMVDRRPAYHIGMVFDDQSPEFIDRLTAFLQVIDNAA